MRTLIKATSCKLMQKIFISTLLILFNGNIFAFPSTTATTAPTSSKCYFIENKGQWPNEVLFLTSIGSLDVWITKSGMVYDFYEMEEVPNAGDKDNHKKFNNHMREDYRRTGHVVNYKIHGSNENIKTEGKQKQEAYYNYFLGNNPDKFSSNVCLYKEAIVKNVYDGVDIRYYFDKESIRFDYIVHPFADASQIKFNLEGANNVQLNQNGNLVFGTCLGEIELAELFCYQGDKSTKVRSRFEMKDGKWRIALGSYDRSKTLIVDPLIYSTFLGGSLSEKCYGVALDKDGNAYVTGSGLSLDFPTTIGAYQVVLNGNRDIFITKLNAAGSNIVFSSFVGGLAEDDPYSIDVDNDGNSYVCGETYSTNFPTTAGAFQTSNVGTGTGFVVKLNNSGTNLSYSTYLGGTVHDRADCIDVDSFGNAYVAGVATSTDFPTTAGAYQTTTPGGDVFISKLNPSGSALIYSTFAGGSNGFEEPYGIKVDGSGNVFFGGETYATNFPTSPGAVQPNFAGGALSDAFVAKLNSNGTNLLFGTYLGGTMNESVRGLDIDAMGNVYVVGFTESSDFPISPNAFQSVFAGGAQEVYVTKLNSNGTMLLGSTFLGGNNTDWGEDIVTDSDGNIYITGSSTSSTFPVTPDAVQTIHAGSMDVFLSKLNSDCSNLIYSSYLGHGSNDNGEDIALTSARNPVICGFTGAPAFPTTAGAFQTTKGGSNDGFVTKFELPAPAGIEIVTKASNVHVFPNPTSSLVNITNLKGSTEVAIFDLQGKLLMTKQCHSNNWIAIDVSNLTEGVYILKVVGNNHTSQTKLAIQK